VQRTGKAVKLVVGGCGRSVNFLFH
jgi:hypothetical protein